MKNIFAACCCAVLYVAGITACTQTIQAATPSPTAIFALTATPSPSSTPPPIDTPTNTVQITASPTLDRFPKSGDFQPGLLTIKTLDTFTGHKLQKITGWRYGYDGVTWMDNQHLLLYPIIGLIRVGGDRSEFRGAYPVTINTGSGQAWASLSEKGMSRASKANQGNPYGSWLPTWSQKLGILITAGSDKSSIAIYNLDGKLIKTYQGEITGVSPSATKILVDGNTWIDLETGKTVKFDWPKLNPDLDSLAIFYTHPIWSPDETRVYVCCYSYGDATTGKSLNMPNSTILVDGRQTFHLDTFYGTWVKNNDYLLVQYGGVWDGRPNFVPLFDPAKNTYHNLNALVGAPYSFENDAEPYCHPPFAAVGSQYVWLDCGEQDYLIDLATFKYKRFSDLNYIEDVDWSTDRHFAIISSDDTNNRSVTHVLSTANGDLKETPYIQVVNWHPTDNIVAYLSHGSKTLSFLNVATLDVQEATLPDVFQSLVWSPDGKHIALLAKDTSIWQIDYPSLQNLQQLTPAMTEINPPVLGMHKPHAESLVWSPDSTLLAYVGNMDVYIVDMKNKP